MDRLAGAYSEHTLRGYRADFGLFDAWCGENGRKPLPASPRTVAAFIAFDAQKSSSSTLRRRLASIRKVHRLLRLVNPVTDEEVLTAYRRALRSKTRRPKQALGLTRPLRDQLMDACPADLAGRRDRALIAVGYDTLCRRSELAALKAEDIEQHSGGGASILIRRAKNDPFGEGRLAYLTGATVDLLEAWLKAAGIKDAWLFRRVSPLGAVGTEPLHPYSVNRILKTRAEAAGVAPETVQRLSGHSMRVGAAQDMIGAGLSILPIMQAGGWKSINVVARYVQHADLGPLMDRLRDTGRRAHRG